MLYCPNFVDASVLSQVYFPKLRSIIVRGSYGRTVELREIDVNKQRNLETLKLYQTCVSSAKGFSQLHLKVCEVFLKELPD